MADVHLIFVSELIHAIRIIWILNDIVLHIQATLFTGIVTAFLLQTLTGEQDQTPKMVALLAEISRQLGPESTAIVKTLADAHLKLYSDIVESHSRARLVIRLWFASIALTLASAIFAMLAKQWMSEYTEGLA